MGTFEVDELAAHHLTPRARKHLAEPLQTAAGFAGVRLLTDGWIGDDFGLFVVTERSVAFISRDDRSIWNAPVSTIVGVERTGGGGYAGLAMQHADGTRAEVDEVGDEAWAHELVTTIDRLRGVDGEETVPWEEPPPVPSLLEPDAEDGLPLGEHPPSDLRPEGLGEERGQPGYDPYAIVALVFGVFLGCGVTSLFALVLGNQARYRIATSGARGEDLAKAAMVLGWIGLALSAAAVLVSFALPALAG